jgi:hypothetical protein
LYEKGYFERRMTLATIQQAGEKVRQAVKWISGELKEDESRSLSKLIEDASIRFNLSPKEEEFLRLFYQESNG